MHGIHARSMEMRRSTLDTASKEQEQPAQVIVGYIPLLWPGSANAEDINSVSEAIHNLPDGFAHGCAWIIRDGQLCPVLIMKDAEEIANHMNFWAEGHPEKWFTLNWTRDKESYALALVPSITKMFERFSITFQLRHGFPFPKERKTSVFFRFLHFRSKRPDIELAGEKVPVYILDSDKIGGNLEEALSKATLLGEFGIEMDTEIVKGILNET